MNWLALVPSALSAISSLTAKKNPPPQYQAPQMAPMGQQLPSYASLFGEIGQQAGPAYDPAQGDLYKSLMSQYQGGQLPPEYRAAVLGQAQQEAGAAYDQASTRLTRDRDRTSRSAAESMNKMGLLSSGAHGIRQGYIDEGFGEQLGGLASQYQTTLGRASTGLMEQELSMRDRTASLLAGIEQQRAQASLSSRQGLMSAVGQERALQAQMANQQAGYAQQNAASQYASQQYGYQQNAAARGNLFSAAGSLATNYGAQKALGKDYWKLLFGGDDEDAGGRRRTIRGGV